MSASLNVLIYDWRYIIAKGIEAILKDHFIFINVKIVQTQEEFLFSLRNERYEVIFLNESKFEKVVHFFDPSRQVALVLIGNKKLHNHSAIKFYLPLGASENYFIKNFTQKILNGLPDFGSEQDSGELTSREKDVLKLVALGYTNQQIAEKLYISPHTVITHRKNITRKLGIKTISGLTIYAILNNIISLEELDGKNIK